jgi:phytoene desaturase
MNSVLIIGAGVGGIATAARLAQKGFKVSVVEKNEQPGGRCGILVKDGHRFDTGATIFMMPELYRKTFEDLGMSIEKELALRRINPTYQIFFSDESKLELSSDLNAMQTQLDEIEPGSFGNYLRYLNEGHYNYKKSLENLVEKEYTSLAGFLNPGNIVLFLKSKALFNHYKHIGNYFNDPRLKIAFTFQNMYMGLNPFEAPAIFSLLQYTELTDGLWFPKGGMYRIVEVLVNKAQEYGVEFHYNAKVAQVNVRNGVVRGLILDDGRLLEADLVVANADLPYVYDRLLPDKQLAEEVKKKKFGCSTIMFYWGMDQQYPQLRPHNLFLTSEGPEGFDPIFKDLTVPENPNFYVHAPVRVDESLAPPGQDTLVVAIPVGHLDDETDHDWSAHRNKCRESVLKRMKKVVAGDFDQHIKFEISITPSDWLNRYNLVKGATHGLSHDLMQMGYFRPPNRHPHYKNLYFVGASTHPGTGIPTVLVSARLTTERILQDFGVQN